METPYQAVKRVLKEYSTKKTLQSSDSIRILLIGNNPMSVGVVHKHLQDIEDASYSVEITFSIKDSFLRALKWRPHCIIVHDSFRIRNIKRLLRFLQKDFRTQDIPVALVKSDNYHQLTPEGIQDYMMQDALSPARLARAIMNTVKLKQTQHYLAQIYKQPTRWAQVMAKRGREIVRQPLYVTFSGVRYLKRQANRRKAKAAQS